MERQGKDTDYHDFPWRYGETFEVRNVVESYMEDYLPNAN